METITKITVNTSDFDKTAYMILLINKVNELTGKVNELNYTVGVLHEWKLQKEGI